MPRYPARGRPLLCFAGARTRALIQVTLAAIGGRFLLARGPARFDGGSLLDGEERS
jgi:hypothetical protein